MSLLLQPDTNIICLRKLKYFSEKKVGQDITRSHFEVLTPVQKKAN